MNVPGWTGIQSEGVWVIVPDAASATLVSLSPASWLGPAGFATVVPLLVVTDSSTATSYRTDSLRFGAGVVVTPPTVPGGVPTVSVPSTGGITLPDVSATLDSGAVRVEVDPTVSDSLDTVVRTEVDPTVPDSLDAGTVRAEVDPFIPDSLDAGTVRAEVDPFIPDSLDANVTRGATIKADTASLALIGDQIYPRTAGGGVDTTKFVSATAPQAVYGDKRFDGITTLVTTKQDSTKGTVVDTLQYWVTGTKDPTWPAGGAGATASQRPGWVDFYIEWSGNRVDNGLPTFSLVSDTANNVYMELVEYTIVGSYFTNFRWSGKRLGVLAVFDQFSWVKAQIATVGGNSGNYNPDIQVINRASWGNVGLYFNAPNAAGHVRCWLRVHYQVSPAAAGPPAANTSTYYVKLEG
jgi:hypothetical protein